MQPTLARHTLLALPCLAALAFAPPAPAACPVEPRFPDATLSDWQQREFQGRTDYTLQDQDGQRVLVATADGSASVLYREREIDVVERPILQWSWSVDDIFEDIRETTRAGDDFPARLYVVVKTGLFPWNTLALNYVWGSQVEAGTDWPSPYTDKSHMIAVRAGREQAGRWVCESRDVVADFQAAFGISIERIQGYAVMVDGDDGGRRARARFGDIAFVARGASGE